MTLRKLITKDMKKSLKSMFNTIKVPSSESCALPCHVSSVYKII